MAEQTQALFEMVLVDGDGLIPCAVYRVTMEGSLDFYRVTVDPAGKDPRTWEIDKEDYCENPEDLSAVWEKKWVSIENGFPSPMAEILGAAIDTKLRELENSNDHA